MDREQYKKNLLDLAQSEGFAAGNPDEVIYQIDDVSIYGGFDMGVRGIDHNVLKIDGVEWTEIFEWGALVVPETRTYISRSRMKQFDSMGYQWKRSAGSGSCL